MQTAKLVNFVFQYYQHWAIALKIKVDYFGRLHFEFRVLNLHFAFCSLTSAVLSWTGRKLEIDKEKRNRGLGQASCRGGLAGRSNPHPLALSVTRIGHETESFRVRDFFAIHLEERKKERKKVDPSQKNTSFTKKKSEGKFWRIERAVEVQPEEDNPPGATRRRGRRFLPG